MLTLPYVLFNTTVTPISVWCATYWVITLSFEQSTSFLRATSCSVTAERAFVNSELIFLDSGSYLLFSGSEHSNSLPVCLRTILFTLLDLLEKFLARSLSSAVALSVAESISSSVSLWT